MSQFSWDRFKQNRLTQFGCVVLGIMIVVAILAPLFAPYDPTLTVSDDTLPPTLHHPFGTDEVGRDILSRAMFGARISMSVGFIAVSISILIGTLFGAISGYASRWLDEVMMRFVDVMLSFPTFFLILAVQSMLPPSIYNIMIIIGLFSWMGVARLVRSEFLSLKERDFVEAARAIGASRWRIIFRHILPNTLPPIIVSATLGMAGAILVESGLSFLGFGVQPPTASWGNMLTNAQGYMEDAWWMTVFPGSCILLTVLSLYFVGEGLRDAFDPKEERN